MAGVTVLLGVAGWLIPRRAEAPFSTKTGAIAGAAVAVVLAGLAVPVGSAFASATQDRFAARGVDRTVTDAPAPKPDMTGDGKTTLETMVLPATSGDPQRIVVHRPGVPVEVLDTAGARLPMSIAVDFVASPLAPVLADGDRLVIRDIARSGGIAVLGGHTLRPLDVVRTVPIAGDQRRRIGWCRAVPRRRVVALD